jgi:menaquinone-dependent protoporphyrinogen IX oxidase
VNNFLKEKPLKKALVTYTTNSGSTEDVARRVADELGKNGAQVDLIRLEQVTQLAGYDAVIIGAPMILGWHRAARKFIQQHQSALSKVPVAYFAIAMSLTQTGEDQVGGVPIFVDSRLAKLPRNAHHLSFRENYATPKHYFQPILKAAAQIKPVSIALFGGKLELFRLPLLQMLFVILVVQAQPGDLRNWTAVGEWAANFRSMLLDPGA